MESIPPHLKNKDLCRIAVIANGLALKEVPEDLRTDEICNLAVRQDGRALSFVPNALRTEAIYEMAWSEEFDPLPYIPEEFFELRARIAMKRPPVQPVWDEKLLDELEAVFNPVENVLDIKR